MIIAAKDARRKGDVQSPGFAREEMAETINPREAHMAGS
jgi:hypothetical protein